jgi:hypothetical protein
MLLFEHSRDMYEEIKEMYPVWYREVVDMTALWTVFGTKLEEIKNDILRAVDNNFIDYADAATITKLETFLRITHDEPRTIDERRKVIKAFIVGHGKIGQQQIKELVAVFTNNEVGVEFSQGVITVTVVQDITNPFRSSDVRFILEARIPAHLALVLSENFEFTSKTAIYVLSASTSSTRISQTVTIDISKDYDIKSETLLYAGVASTSSIRSVQEVDINLTEVIFDVVGETDIFTTTGSISDTRSIQKINISL